MGEMVKCPSGLSGEVRGLTGAEARLLSDRQALKSGVFVDNILNKCWVSTLDPGPYDVQDGGKPDWSKVLVGDRFFVFMKIREQTVGSAFGFKVQCKACRLRFDHEIDVSTLPVKELSDEDRAAFAAGNQLTGTLPEGRRFTFRLLTGADEARFAKMGASTTSFLAPHLARISSIEGLDALAQRKYFDEQPLGHAMAAIQEMDSHDCGVETKIEIECPQCYEAWELEIPFGQGFLVPSTRKS